MKKFSLLFIALSALVLAGCAERTYLDRFTVSDCEVTMGLCLGIIYIVGIFTVFMITLQKGRYVMAILGFIFPFLWLIGAVLPAKKGSAYEQQMQNRYRYKE